jgi:hypothetical protein
VRVCACAEEAVPNRGGFAESAWSKLKPGGPSCQVAERPISTCSFEYAHWGELLEAHVSMRRSATWQDGPPLSHEAARLILRPTGTFKRNYAETKKRGLTQHDIEEVWPNIA